MQIYRRKRGREEPEKHLGKGLHDGQFFDQSIMSTIEKLIEKRRDRQPANITMRETFI